MHGVLRTFANVSWRSLRVWQRHALVFRRSWWLNFLPPLLEPILYVVAFGLGLGRLIGSVTYLGQELPYLRFMAPGLIAVAIMYNAYFETTYASFVRMYYQRTFDAIVATPLLVEDVIAGEWLWGASKALVASSIMLGVLGALGLVHWPSGLLVVPLAVVGGLLFAGLGLVTTSLSPSIDGFNLPIFLLVFPMFLFSGTFFPVDTLPGWALRVAWILPLTHVAALVRGACLAEPPPHWAGSLAYLVGVAFGVSALALVLMRRRLVK
jgi:lipooligosaccharide transport system permease protein